LLALPSIRQTTTEPVSPIGSANIALLCIVAVGIGQALITALGRYNFGLDQAMSGRYYSVRLVIWACTALMALGIAARARAHRGQWTLLMVVLSLCAVVTLASDQRVLGKAAKGGATAREIATASILTGVIDEAALTSSGSPPIATSIGVAYLKPRKLSVFADRWFGAFGQPIQSMVAVRPPQDCIGYIGSISQDAVTGGAKVHGWGWSVTDKRRFDRIVLVDQQDRIVGLGVTSLPRPDVRAVVPDVRASDVGWVGYARPADMVSAYGIIDQKFACKLQGALPVGSGKPDASD
jgi:hypothetical protein